MSLVERAGGIRGAVPSSDGKRFAFRCAACGKGTYAEEKVEGEITTYCGCRFEDASGERAATAATTGAAGRGRDTAESVAPPRVSPSANGAPPEPEPQRQNRAERRRQLRADAAMMKLALDRIHPPSSGHVTKSAPFMSATAKGTRFPVTSGLARTPRLPKWRRGCRSERTCPPCTS
jgi:hypothetical protein